MSDASDPHGGSGHGDEAHPALLNASIDCVKIVGLDGSLLSMDPEGLCVMEIDDFSVFEGRPWSSFWPEAQKPTVEAAVAQAAVGRVARFSAFCPTAKGTPRHWDVVVSPVHNEAGQVTQLLSISRDVTRDVRQADERALVARELSHRIKNLFAVVDGVIGMSARSEPRAEQFADALRRRLAGLGRAVAYVYSKTQNHAEIGGSGTVHGLLRQLLTPYGADPTDSRITVRGEDRSVGEGAVTALALLFNELATNALKYGPLSGATGAVSIATRIEAGMLEIVWLEQGNEPVSHPLKTGFGTSLVDRTVKSQFGGTIERRWLADGLRIEIRIPSSQLD